VNGVADFYYSGSVPIGPQAVHINFGVDGSGSLSFSENSVPRYQADWLADGSGTWTVRDAQGIETDSGTF